MIIHMSLKDKMRKISQDDLQKERHLRRVKNFSSRYAHTVMEGEKKTRIHFPSILGLDNSNVSEMAAERMAT